MKEKEFRETLERMKSVIPRLEKEGPIEMSLGPGNGSITLTAESAREMIEGMEALVCGKTLEEKREGARKVYGI